MEEILSLGVTLIDIVVMTLFGYVHNVVWDQLRGCLDVISLLVGHG